MLERPTVTVSNSGVSSVKAADIIRSRAGQAELRKTRDAKIYKTGKVTVQSPEGSQRPKK